MSDSFLTSRAWRFLRRLALERDHYRCVECKVDVSAPGAARVDHIKPRSTHPELARELSNIRTLCTRCDNQAHREKGAKVKTGGRRERIAITGFRADGSPIDPNHHWNRK